MRLIKLSFQHNYDVYQATFQVLVEKVVYFSCLQESYIGTREMAHPV